MFLFLALVLVALFVMAPGPAPVPGPRKLNMTDRGEVYFWESRTNGTNTLMLRAPASVASNVTWDLPNADGASGEFIKTDGAGVLSWGNAGAASLDSAYDNGASITADAGTVTITAATNNPMLTLTQSGVVAADVLSISTAGTGQGINVTTGEITVAGDINASSNVVLGNSGVVKIGDTDISRSAANTVQIADTLSLEGNNGKTSLTIDANDSDTDAGLTIGGDANLYRSAADTLVTDDIFGIKKTGSGVATFQITDTGASTGMTIGGDTRLYRNAADTLATDAQFIIQETGSGKTTFQISDTGTDIGMTLGLDTNLYRSSANNLTTDDTFDAAGGLKVGTGGTINTILTGSTSHNFTSISDGTNQTITFAVTGCALGDFCIASAGVQMGAGVVLEAEVAATDTVRVTVLNESGSPFDPADTTYRVIVFITQ